MYFKNILKRYKEAFIFLLITLTIGYLAARAVHFSSKEFIDGIPKGLQVIKFMFPPDWAAFSEMLIPAVETIIIAILGTIFGSVFSIIFGLAAASNISPQWLRATSRFLIALERSLPEIVIILILVAGLGLGPFPGIMALAIGCIGMLGKLFADAIEEIDHKLIESIQSTGANKLQVIRFGVIPQILPSILANTIFRFEINIRTSVILGAVGAGGIGYELYHSFGLLDYQRTTTAIIIILILVFGTERLSDFLQQRILNERDVKKIKEVKHHLPSQKYKRQMTFLAATVALIVFLFIMLKINPIIFFTDFHYMVDLIIKDMLPPNFKIFWTDSLIFKSLLETLSMAFLGALIGGVIALSLAFFASSNTAPNKVIRMFIRTLLAFERVTPSLVIILILIIALGIGPFAGACALIIGTLGTFGKLFSDSIEHVEWLPVEAIYSTGANKLQAIRYGILPQALPSIIANWFYALDVNLRLAIGLGIFGGGGIGFQLYMAMKVMRYKDALTLVLVIIVLISSIEKLSDYFRRKIINEAMI